VSRDLEHWLRDDVGVPAGRVTQIYNGVDMTRFKPAERAARDVLPAGFAAPNSVVIGTVGRLSGEKDQANLIAAFARARRSTASPELRLVLVGDGPLQENLREHARALGIAEQVWFAGPRSDVAEVLRAFDVFVLPSLGEGISNTILEAMACGRPVIATRVGGNPELVLEQQSGLLVPAADPDALAAAMVRYARDPALRQQHGAAGRARIEREFSMEAMVARYREVYDAALR
jgi:sugar transferase (PEP-CTERM/EpsH1 system associated)